MNDMVLGKIQLPERYRKLTAFDLKLIACVSMVLDHAARIFRFHGIAQIICSQVIGRIAFPLFCFLLAEGYLHTRNTRKYLTRLFLCALLSELSYDRMFPGVFFLQMQNTLFSLSLGLAMFLWMDAVRKEAQETRKGIILPFLSVVLCAVAATILHLDYQAGGILCMACCYAGNNKERRYPVLAIVAGCIALVLCGTGEACALLGIVPVLFYNGKHGWQMEGKEKTLAKYAFYAFYPMHLIVLEFLAHVAR